MLPNLCIIKHTRAIPVDVVFVCDQRTNTLSSVVLQDIQQLLQLQQLVLVPGHPLQSPAHFLLPQTQQGPQGEQGGAARGI